MAQSKYIQSVLDAAKGRPKSTEWYKDKIKEFGTPGAMDLIRDGKRDSRPFYGRLNMFIYDPKFKKKLPYYDTFPLVLPLENGPFKNDSEIKTQKYCFAERKFRQNTFG